MRLQPYWATGERPNWCATFMTPSETSLKHHKLFWHGPALTARTRNLFCYRDMSSRDLLQRRTFLGMKQTHHMSLCFYQHLSFVYIRTDPWGNTGWSDSPLVQASIDLMWPKFVGSHLPTQQAALHGDLAVLHGVHRLSKAGEQTFSTAKTIDKIPRVTWW